MGDLLEIAVCLGFYDTPAHILDSNIGEKDIRVEVLLILFCLRKLSCKEVTFSNVARLCKFPYDAMQNFLGMNRKTFPIFFFFFVVIMQIRQLN